MSNQPADMGQPHQTRVIKSGYLKRFKKGFLSKGFKYVFVELYSDSHFLWYRDQCSSKPDGVVFLKDVCNFLAVGPYTQSIATRPNLPRGSSERHILAVPVHPCRNTYVHWFMFCNDADLNDWMVKINSTLPPLPPPVGSPRDEQHPKEPPPPYTGHDGCHNVNGISNSLNNETSSSNSIVPSGTEPLALAVAAGSSLWGWTWGWGGGWGCDGWGCFDYGPSASGDSSNSSNVYQHQQHYENNCQHGSDPQYDNGTGYDCNGYENGSGYEYCEAGGADVGMDVGVDSSAFDVCAFDIGF